MSDIVEWGMREKSQADCRGGHSMRSEQGFPLVDSTMHKIMLYRLVSHTLIFILYTTLIDYIIRL